MRFAKLFFWTVFLFFTASASRRSYYLLPVLPAAAMLVARLLTTPLAELTRTARWLLITGYGLAAGGFVMAVVALAPAQQLLPEPLNQLPGLPAPWVFAAVWVLGIAGI